MKLLDLSLLLIVRAKLIEAQADCCQSLHPPSLIENPTNKKSACGEDNLIFVEDSFPVSSVENCGDICKNVPSCQFFTYNSGFCGIRDYTPGGIVTGSPQQQIGSKNGEVLPCNGKVFVGKAVKIPGGNSFDCQTSCQKDPLCNSWTWKKTESICSHNYGQTQRKLPTPPASGIVSGPKFCQCTEDQFELTVYNCGNAIGNNFLDASEGSWPANLFCMAYDGSAKPNPTISYTISVDLYNYQSTGGNTIGHLGLAYNFLDVNNYEALYVRTHTKSGCLQFGEVKDGKFIGGKRSACDNWPNSRIWFNLKVEVDSDTKTAKVFIDGKLENLGSLPLKRPTKKAGAVIVVNGYKNSIFYKNFRIL